LKQSVRTELHAHFAVLETIWKKFLKKNFPNSKRETDRVKKREQETQTVLKSKSRMVWSCVQWSLTSAWWGGQR